MRNSDYSPLQIVYYFHRFGSKLIKAESSGIEVFLLFSGFCHCLDVEFDDPSSGFFLRDASATTNAAISTAATTHVARDIVDDENDDKVKTMPTTSIVLGENKEDGTKHSTTNYMGDILHSAR